MADVSAEFRAQLKSQEQDEDILKDNPSRWVILPIKFPAVWKMFKKHETAFWTAEDIVYPEDTLTLNLLPKDAAIKLKNLIAFQALRDGKLYESFSFRSCKLLGEVQIPEARAFYGFQCAFENIHQEVNCHLMETYEPDEATRNEICEQVLQMGSVRAKGAWVSQHMRDDFPFAEKVMVLCITKRIFNAAAQLFCLWTQRNGILPAFSAAYKHISEDELMHAEFSIILMNTLKYPLPFEVVKTLIEETVAIETEFASDFLCLEHMGITKEQVKQHLEFVADKILTQMQLTKLYEVTNPFQWAYEDVSSGALDAQATELGTGCTSDGNSKAFKDVKFSMDEDF